MWDKGRTSTRRGNVLSSEIGTGRRGVWLPTTDGRKAPTSMSRTTVSTDCLHHIIAFLGCYLGCNQLENLDTSSNTWNHAAKRLQDNQLHIYCFSIPLMYFFI